MAAPKDNVVRTQPVIGPGLSQGSLVGGSGMFGGLQGRLGSLPNFQQAIEAKRIAQQQEADKKQRARNYQTEMIRYLGGIASGDMKSQAMLDAEAQSRENRAGIQSLAASQRGPANVLQSKNTAMALANQAQADARTMAQIRAQEILTYNQMLANQINTARGQDLGLETSLLDIATQRDISEDRANANIIGGALQGVGGAVAQYNTNRTQPTTQNIAPGSSQQIAGNRSDVMPSDKELKKEIKTAQKDIKRFMDDLKPYKFKYKDEKHGKGEQVGIMAQDLEKSKAGKEAVIDMPEGKMVDLKKSIPLVLASIGDLNKRLKNIEGGNGGD